jgi:hypothetical protein
MVLALFEYMNAQLVERQANFFIDPGLPLSTKWDVACDYLDADLASGYVRVLQEMIAAAWAHPPDRCGRSHQPGFVVTAAQKISAGVRRQTRLTGAVGCRG